MASCPSRGAFGRRGYVLLAALAVVTILAMLGVSICWQARSGTHQSANLRRIQAARMQAESGLAYMSCLLRRTPVPITIEPQETLEALAVSLSERLAGAGTAVTYDGERVSIGEIAPDGAAERFGVQLWMPGARCLSARATGRCGAVRRSVQMNFQLVGGHPVFGYGISSRGPVCLENNVEVLGANDRSEARLLSLAPGTAFRLSGGLTLEGDIYAADPGAEVSVSGDGTIGGTPMNDPNVSQHIHVGEGESDLPEIDTSAFEPFATNIVDADTDTSGTKTFTNIRIKAGANPTFQNGVKIDGVIFIETPNRVTFAEGSTITGVICTQEAAGPRRDNEIRFEVSTHSDGVDALPDTAEFHELREMGGSFILAPGFGVKFENESGVINGVVAAGHVKFENSFRGTLCGGIISYGTEEIMAEDFSSFTVDHSKYPRVPAGFRVDEPRLVPDPNSYVED